MSVHEVRCSRPACPFDTVVTVQLPAPKTFTIAERVEEVAQADVTALLEKWADVLRRANDTGVQAWAEAALPKAVAGQQVMVDEVDTGHMHADQALQTWIYVFASPKPWSMKVMKPLERVTQKNVTDVMALAALSGGLGMPSVA